MRRTRHPCPSAVLVAALGTAALVTAGAVAAPARAGHATVEWRAPASAGSVLRADQPVEFTISLPLTATLLGDRVTAWELELVGVDGPVAVLCRGEPDAADPVPVAFRWDTRFYPAPHEPAGACDGGLVPATATRWSANGGHELVVRVWSSGTGALSGPHAGESRLSVVLHNEPSAPARVLARVGESGGVGVSWPANPEPDITGYRVQHCATARPSEPCPESSWVHLAAVGPGQTTVTLSDPAPGAHRFRVAALRPAGSSDMGSTGPLTSPWSVTERPVVVAAGGPPAEVPGGEPRTTEGRGGPEPGSGSPATVRGFTAGPRDAPSGEGPGRLPRAGTGGALEATRPEWPPEAAPIGSVARPATGLLAGERGRALVLVPLAAAVMALVFCLQIRTLLAPAVAAGRQDDAGAVGLERPAGPMPRRGAQAPGPHRGAVGPVAAGSFITHWRRWLEPSPH